MVPIMKRVLIKHSTYLKHWSFVFGQANTLVAIHNFSIWRHSNQVKQRIACNVNSMNKKVLLRDLERSIVRGVACPGGQEYYTPGGTPQSNRGGIPPGQDQWQDWGVHHKKGPGTGLWTEPVTGFGVPPPLPPCERADTFQKITLA